MFSLRVMALITFLFCLAVICLANASHKIVLSAGLIMLFLIIFTYIFKTDGSKTLKVLVILFTFFGLPLFLLIYLDIFNQLDGILGIAVPVILAAVFGFISIFLIIQLDSVELNL